MIASTEVEEMGDLSLSSTLFLLRALLLFLPLFSHLPSSSLFHPFKMKKKKKKEDDGVK